MHSRGSTNASLQGALPGDPGAARQPGVPAAAGAPVVADPGAAPVADAPLHAVPRPGDRCAWQSLEGEAVIIDLSRRRVMGLNPAGSFLWCQADGVRSVAQLADALAGHFRIPPQRAQADAQQFFGRMAQRGLVDLSTTGAQP